MEIARKANGFAIFLFTHAFALEEAGASAFQPSDPGDTVFAFFEKFP